LFVKKFDAEEKDKNYGQGGKERVDNPGCFENVADRKEGRETWGILRIPAAIVHHVWKIEDFLSTRRRDV